MGELDDIPDREDDVASYLDTSAVEPIGLRQALCSLQFFGDDPYLSVQATNIDIVDRFIMQLEYDVLRRLHQDERTPGPEAAFLSAQSQMWIFAVYELLRTWRQRATDMIKWHDNGGLKKKLAALQEPQGFVHTGRNLRSRQLQEAIDDPRVIARLRDDKRLTHMAFRRLEFIRVSLAKHEVSGQKNSIATAPGYGRINLWCGSLEYQLENGMVILGTITRRDVADELRATNQKSALPTDDDIRSFDAFMDARPSDLAWDDNASGPGTDI
jgi:hypothetical protein